MSSRRRFLLSAAAALAVLLAPQAASGAVLPAQDLIANPSFESNLSGWGGWDSTQARINPGDAPHGTYVVRVTSTGSGYTLDEVPDTVDGNAQEGVTYSARAWVKATPSSLGDPIELVMREWDSGGNAIVYETTEAILTSSWQHLDVSLEASTTGHTIDAFVARPSDSSTVGEQFLVDAFSMVSDAILPGNVVSNPTFESSTSGWSAVNSALTRPAATDAPHGKYVGRAAMSASVAAYGMDDASPSVSQSHQGFTYRASAWVKGNSVSSGDPLQLRIRERTPGGTLVGSNVASVNLSSSQWSRVDVSRVASATGNRLEVDLLRPSGTVTAGDIFFADPISMHLDDTSACPGALGGFAAGNWPAACWRPYGAASPFNSPIPSDAPLAAGSEDVVADLRAADPDPDHITVGDPWMDSGNPTYYSQPTDPLFTLNCTKYGGNCSPGVEGATIRIPDAAVPEGGITSSPQWTTATAATPFGNRTPDPSFEGTATGWVSSGGTVTAVANGSAPHGSKVASVARSGSSPSYSIGQWPAAVDAKAEGRAHYAARAWVRGTASSNGKQVDLIVRESNGSGEVGRITKSVILSSSGWQKVEVSYPPLDANGLEANFVGEGNSIDVYLSRNSNLSSGETFLVDGVHMIKWRDFDAHLTVVDQASGWEYDLWNVQSKPAGGGILDFGWGGRTRVGTDGDGLGSEAVAAGYGNLAGIIRGPELQAGVINHALVMYVPCTDTSVYPADGPDYPCAGLGIDHPPPMGALFRVDMPDWEIDALPIPVWKKAVLRALAHYGAYVVDTSANNDQWGFEIEGGHTYRSFGATDPFVSLAQSLGPGLVGTADYTENAPCPVPSMVYADAGGLPSECKTYGQTADPGNMQLDEYWYEFFESTVDFGRLEWVSDCVPSGTC